MKPPWLSYRAEQDCDILRATESRDSRSRRATGAIETSRSTWIKSALSGAFVSSAMCAATPAMALEARQCMSVAQMNEALRDDGQRTMIIGDRIAAVGDTANPGVTVRTIRNINTITSNQDGSLGYQLEGNNSRSERSTWVCVRGRLADIHFYDARRIVIPEEAYLGGDFNRTVDRVAASGNRPMVIAKTIFGADSARYYGRPLVVLGTSMKELVPLRLKL